MTWLGDKVANTNGVPMADAKIEKLKADRAVLVKKVEALGKITTFRTESAKRFHQEDLTKLAKEIGAIDRKLGRT